MRDCMIAPPFCDQSTNQCGWPNGAVIYWVSFQMILFFLLSSMIVAIVMNAFDNQLDTETESEYSSNHELDLDDLIAFNTVWMEHLPASYSMPVSKLPEFLAHIPADLGGSRFAGKLSQKHLWQEIKALSIPSDGATVHYLNVLYALTWHAFWHSSKRTIRKMPQVMHELFTEDCALVRAQAIRDFDDLIAVNRHTNCRSSPRHGPPQSLEWCKRITAHLVMATIVFQKVWRKIRVRRLTKIKRLQNTQQFIPAKFYCSHDTVDFRLVQADENLRMEHEQLVGAQETNHTLLEQVRRLEVENQELKARLAAGVSAIAAPEISLSDRPHSPTSATAMEPCAAASSATVPASDLEFQTHSIDDRASSATVSTEPECLTHSVDDRATSATASMEPAAVSSASVLASSLEFQTHSVEDREIAVLTSGISVLEVKTEDRVDATDSPERPVAITDGESPVSMPEPEPEPEVQEQPLESQVILAESAAPVSDVVLIEFDPDDLDHLGLDESHFVQAQVQAHVRVQGPAAPSSDFDLDDESTWG
jgi:hypothetical protein